ncbi:HPr family phosphocarrier protein [Streptomyces sp. NPDC005012]|uniref:HPr family phosphocarrier protein n=1 Tax=unclassified Streptomyces TaxID=2593676 RepID=UPI00339EFF2A
MAERRVRVAGPDGLHARPAARFVRAAQESGLPVRVARADGAGAGPVSAASILKVLGLGVRGGEEIVLSCEGEGAEAVLRRLADLVSQPPPRGPGHAML